MGSPASPAGVPSALVTLHVGAQHPHCGKLLGLRLCTFLCRSPFFLGEPRIQLTSWRRDQSQKLQSSTRGQNLLKVFLAWYLIPHRPSQAGHSTFSQGNSDLPSTEEGSLGRKEEKRGREFRISKLRGPGAGRGTLPVTCPWLLLGPSKPCSSLLTRPWRKPCGGSTYGECGRLTPTWTPQARSCSACQHLPPTTLHEHDSPCQQLPALCPACPTLALCPAGPAHWGARGSSIPVVTQTLLVLLGSRTL